MYFPCENQLFATKNPKIISLRFTYNVHQTFYSIHQPYNTSLEKLYKYILSILSLKFDFFIQIFQYSFMIDDDSFLIKMKLKEIMHIINYSLKYMDEVHEHKLERNINTQNWPGVSTWQQQKFSKLTFYMLTMEIFFNPKKLSNKVINRAIEHISKYGNSVFCLFTQ